MSSMVGGLFPDRSDVGRVPRRRGRARGLPIASTVDDGAVSCSPAMDVWSFRTGVKFDFIRSGWLVERSFIDSFSGRLRYECLSAKVGLNLANASKILEVWRHDFNEAPSQGSRVKCTPSEFAPRARLLGRAGLQTKHSLACVPLGRSRSSMLTERLTR